MGYGNYSGVSDAIDRYYGGGSSDDGGDDGGTSGASAGPTGGTTTRSEEFGSVGGAPSDDDDSAPSPGDVSTGPTGGGSGGGSTTRREEFGGVGSVSPPEPSPTPTPPTAEPSAGGDPPAGGSTGTTTEPGPAPSPGDVNDVPAGGGADDTTTRSEEFGSVGPAPDALPSPDAASPPEPPSPGAGQGMGGGATTPAGVQTPGDTGVGDAPGDQGIEAMTATTGSLVMTDEGLTTERDLARDLEADILRENPGLSPDDVAIVRDDNAFVGRYTEAGRRKVSQPDYRGTSRREEFGDVGGAPSEQAATTSRREQYGDVGSVTVADPGVVAPSPGGGTQAATRGQTTTEFEEYGSVGSLPQTTTREEFGGVGRTPSSVRREALADLDKQIDEQFGVDLERGEDYTVQTETDMYDRTGYEARLTDQGEIAVAGRPRTGETWLDSNVINPAIERFERETGTDVPFNYDIVQSAQSTLARDAAIHRTGRGDLPNQAQAEQFGADYAAPGVQAAATAAKYSPIAGLLGGPAVRSLETDAAAESVTRGFYARAGQTINPAGIALGAGMAGESIGEYAFATGVAAGGEPAAALAPNQRIPGTDRTVQGTVAGAREEKGRKQAAAAATGGALLAATAKSAREQPARTAGAGLFEAGTILAGEAVSPLRLTKLDVPTGQRGSTTVRGLRLEEPRIVRAARDEAARQTGGRIGRRGISRRGRTLVGQRGPRLSRGAPSVDVEDIRFDDLPGQGATTEAITPFETDVYQRSVAAYGGDAARRSAAQEQVAQIAGAAPDELKLTSTSDIVREVESVPRDRVERVAGVLEDLDAEIYGSASVRAQFPERARKPGDLDIAVDNEVRAKTKLAGALSGTNADIGDVFDISTKAEKARPGQPTKLGRIAPSRLRTDEGVAVTRASEEFVKKAGAAGFLRGPGSPRPQDVGVSQGFDVGPEPIRPALPPRYKDVGDVSVMGRLFVAEQSEGSVLTAPLRRRGTRRSASAVEDFESTFAADLSEVPATRRPETTPDLPDTRPGITVGGGVQRDLDRLLGGTDRAQFDLVGGGGRRAVDTDRPTPRPAQAVEADTRLAARVDVDDAARRVDTDSPSSPGRVQADDSLTVPAVGSSAGSVRADADGGLASSGGRGPSEPGAGLVGSSGGGRREDLDVGSYPTFRGEDSGGFPSFFDSRGGGGPSPGYGGGGGDPGYGGPPTRPPTFGPPPGDYYDRRPGGGYYSPPGDIPEITLTPPGVPTTRRGGGSSRAPQTGEKTDESGTTEADFLQPAWINKYATALAGGGLEDRGAPEDLESIAAGFGALGMKPAFPLPTRGQVSGDEQLAENYEAVESFFFQGDGDRDDNGGLLQL